MPLKVAIVGTGNICMSNYLPPIVKRGDVTLTLYNRTLAKAEAAAQQCGGRVADSLEDLMASRPDTVLILTRENDRYEAARAVLEFRPKRLFFEKPLVAQQGQANVTENDFYRGRELLQLARLAGAETAMVFNYRFFDQTIVAREIVAAGAFGAMVHVTGLVHYACWSHAIDLILHFAGPVAQITALSSESQRAHGRDRAKDVTVAFRTTGDATGTLIGTLGLGWKLPLYELTFAYEGGRVSMRDLDGDLEAMRYDTARHEVHALARDVSRWDQYRASFGKTINAYLDSVAVGAPPPVPGIAGLRELQFEAAIKRSIAQGRPVDLDREFPLDL